jgi:4-hydroxy-tetrahydrodipicolinate reductase
MKIGLLGYGKMGKAIEKIALERGHEIVLKINAANQNSLNSKSFNQVDVAIEFSLPNTAQHNIEQALHTNTPVVCGTTGWLNNLNEVHHLCTNKNSAFLYASNFSLGVNLFFELNKKLAKLMANHPAYEASIKEIHHSQKIDAPSGTAISLANQIITTTKQKDQWVLNTSEFKNELTIEALRENGVPGTHRVNYQSETDTLSIKHVAHSRNGFALGAVVAAEWILNKKGIFSMKDVLF